MRYFLTLLFFIPLIVSSCGIPAKPAPSTPMSDTTSSTTRVPMKPAFESGIYPNLFADYLGKTDEEIQAKIDDAWNQLFYGDDSSERVYYPVGSDMAYVLDTGNDDVRSEGMSYGMMIAVQLNKKEEFDRIWKWTKTYMYQKDGGYKGYFAWHCKPDGSQLSANPASDGEEWFIMALMFADARWGSGEGIYNYRAEAQSILDVALHADELSGEMATNLFDDVTKQVVFVPQIGKNSSFTDPSYHLPHFLELWARWADKDNQFWADAVQASRDYLKTAVHPQTGLAPNYSYFDGSPYDDEYNGNFRYDAFRVGANVGMDYVWFRPSEWHVEQSNRMLKFFASEGINQYKAEYLLTGEPEVMHRSPGLIATNAVAALAADPEIGEPFVQALWDQELPTGKYRYYDGLLMMLGLLQVSGNFRIYTPGSPVETVIVSTPAPVIEGKFAPPTGRALLLVGQNTKDADTYFNATVAAPGGVAGNVSLNGNDLKDLDYLAAKYPNSALSVGVDMRDSIKNNSSGKADAKIDALLDKLAGYNRPVFLRIGFGFDDPTNAYEPEQFVQAWKKIHERIQAKGITNIALVWESAMLCEGSYNGHPIEEWYPGDEFVDWVGMRYSDQSVECDGKPIEDVLQFARSHFKPVMITEAAPDDSEDSWNGWFAPFFKFVADNNDVIRAATYASGDGNSEFQKDDILKRWKNETRQVFWLRASPDLFNTLGYAR